ncbi:DNA glycosylase AlkZ-like family protein [Rubripirellula amarantea]|nr:crosslink repair DNA glycosylase YcaQ family protein [Rubripirellula amarantea]
MSDALKAMQFVQADPIRSPARAQDLVLRQRVRGYQAGDLERTFPKLRAEEGYLFAYGFMTPGIWQILHPRPHAKLNKLERDLLKSVADVGEVHPRGLDQRFGRRSVKNYWGGQSQETKRILEKLHHHGYLRVSRRENGIRVYQVSKESPAETIDSTERYRRLVMTTARVFGPTTKRFLVAELRTHDHLVPVRSARLAVVDSLVQSGELSEVEVAGASYLYRERDWLPNDVPNRVRILAPFDPLVRDRDRFSKLWDWTYRFEAYVPAAKRERGYYAMPVLWRDVVLGWANASLANDRLSVEFGYVGKKPRAKEFRLLAEAEVEALATFLGLPSGCWELDL